MSFYLFGTLIIERFSSAPWQLAVVHSNFNFRQRRSQVMNDFMSLLLFVEASREHILNQGRASGRCVYSIYDTLPVLYAWTWYMEYCSCIWVIVIISCEHFFLKWSWLDYKPWSQDQCFTKVGFEPWTSPLWGFFLQTPDKGKELKYCPNCRYIKFIKHQRHRITILDYLPQRIMKQGGQRWKQ